MVKLFKADVIRGIRVKENGKVKITRDFSGKPKTVNTDLLNLLLENGYTPVLCVPIIDENNVAINSENDDIINILQNAIKVDKILQFIEAPGFLNDANDPDSLVKKISQNEIKQLEERVEGRMKRKMLALRKLFESGANTVIISDGRIDNPVSVAINGGGTLIQ